jgi:hypothetical protein
MSGPNFDKLDNRCVIDLKTEVNAEKLGDLPVSLALQPQRLNKVAIRFELGTGRGIWDAIKNRLHSLVHTKPRVDCVCLVRKRGALERFGAEVRNSRRGLALFGCALGEFGAQDGSVRTAPGGTRRHHVPPVGCCWCLVGAVCGTVRGGAAKSKPQA